MTADKNSNTSEQVYPETHEAVERWQQGKINIFDEMARLERERDEARAECLEQARLLAMSAEREEKLRAQTAQVERERDEAREMQVKALRERESTEREVEAMLERAIKAERERDEARAEAHRARSFRQVLKRENAKLKRERDEARAALKHIEEYGTEEINAAVDLRHQLAAALSELSELKSEKQANHQCLLMMERDIYKAREERDKAISVAERLVEYAHDCLAKLESWGHGYQRYEDEMDSIREDIAAYSMMKEALQ